MTSILKKTSSFRFHHPVQLVFSHMKHNEETSSYSSAISSEETLSVLAHMERKSPLKCYFCHARQALNIHAKTAVYRSKISNASPSVPHIPLTYHYQVFVRIPMEDLLGIACVLWIPSHKKLNHDNTPWNLLISNITETHEHNLTCLHTIYIP